MRARTWMWCASAVCMAFSSIVAAQPLQGRVESRATTHPTGGHQVTYNIYLPPGYDTSTERYPVIYHLHGIGGNQGGNQNTTVPRAFETAAANGLIGRVIVVFPNGYTDAFWADSFNSPKPAETDVVDALIPHVDGAFRTIPKPEARVIQGFSMGGFGATKFYSKYPELFACCVEYDGALLTWASMLQFHAALAQEIFNNDEAYFNEYQPRRWTADHAVVLRAKPPVRMVVGALVDGNRLFRDHLDALLIPRDYVETTCGHELGCLLTAQGQQSAAFIASNLDLSCTAQVCCDSIDFIRDGLFPDTGDIDGFFSIFAGGPCPVGECGDIDFNNDGFFPDVLDIESFLSVFSGGSCL